MERMEISEGFNQEMSEGCRYADGGVFHAGRGNFYRWRRRSGKWANPHFSESAGGPQK
jgi:hypothetical protein